MNFLYIDYGFYFLIVLILGLVLHNCQTPDLGQGLEFDFTLAKNKKNKKNNNPHPNFPGWDGTRGLKFGIQT